MRLPRVYPILDTESLARIGITLEAAAAAFLEGGAGILQIRHKAHWSRSLFESCRWAAITCSVRQAGMGPGPLSGCDQAQVGEVRSIAVRVSGEQCQAIDRGVGADVEIRQG